MKIPSVFIDSEKNELHYCWLCRIARPSSCQLCETRYYHLSQRVLRFRPYDLERAYGLLQLAMIFIFTLRNAVQIPARPAVEWQVSERDVRAAF